MKKICRPIYEQIYYTAKQEFVSVFFKLCNCIFLAVDRLSSISLETHMTDMSHCWLQVYHLAKIALILRNWNI